MTESLYSHLTNLTRLLSEADLDLLLAFIVREAKDYSWPEEKRADWVKGIMSNIDSALGDETGYDLIVNSFGNTGVAIRSLVLDTKDAKNRRLKIIVNLCTCGKLDHWGSLRVEDTLSLFDEHRKKVEQWI